jgi:hypothetical protein
MADVAEIAAKMKAAARSFREIAAHLDPRGVNVTQGFKVESVTGQVGFGSARVATL